MKHRLIGLFIMLAALLSLGWWLNRWTQPEEVRQPSVKISPDAYADALVVDSYDAGGNLKQRLQSKGMKFFDNTGITELRQPRLWHYNQQGPPWRMEADRGVIRGDQEIVHLPGPVVIDRPGGKETAPLHITTQDLTLHSDRSMATTEGPVRIESDAQWVTAVGMQAWFQQPMRLKLLHKVRGYYEFQ
ncbi:MAG: LPS export ABC transporter periplasmic protein LptC [gamma proteobacterium symbiont of Ctena orbiculata]|nr:MAG: LPS export ABC transporter periplasmic protein LptC [gamma proteobacterium symbiont of Ctena orbiculata]